MAELLRSVSSLEGTAEMMDNATATWALEATEAVTAIATTSRPTDAPTVVNLTESFIQAELAEEEHEFDALSALLLNLVIIGCLLLAYVVKKFKIYSLPESAGALMVGMIIGGLVRCTTDDLSLFEFVRNLSPSIYLFYLPAV